MADLILFLDLPLRVRRWRIIKRFLRQKMGIESANYRTTFQIFRKMFTWSNYFEETMKPEFLRKLEQYPEKVRMLQSPSDVEKLFEEVSG